MKMDNVDSYMIKLILEEDIEILAIYTSVRKKLKLQAFLPAGLPAACLPIGMVGMLGRLSITNLRHWQNKIRMTNKYLK